MRGEPPAAVDHIVCRRQGWGQLQKGRSIADGNGPLCLNGKTYADGRTVPLLGGTDFAAEPPLAFQCGGVEARTVLARCARRHEVVAETAAVTVHRVLYADAATGLEFSLELKEFHDFPAAEWVWHVRNSGASGTHPGDPGPPVGL